MHSSATIASRAPCTGGVCYSRNKRLRTTVNSFGQNKTEETYLGVDGEEYITSPQCARSVSAIRSLRNRSGES